MHMRAMSAQISGLAGEAQTPTREVVYLNGRYLAGLLGEGLKPPQTLVDSCGKPILAVRTAAEATSLLSLTGTELAIALVQKSEVYHTSVIKSADFAWDFMEFSPTALAIQLGRLTQYSGAQALRDGVSGVQKIGDHPVVCGDNISFLPSTVFDTRLGAIHIGAGTEIEPFCYLQGPLFIGDNCRIKSGTKLYQGSSFGKVCRVGGEIGNSVLQSYVNKQHDGFLGNSHLGSWVNLGADTTTSNLRNDYGTVKMKVGGKLIDSESMNIGLIAGDHTKTGINTMLNTGTIAGVGCNIFGADYPPRFIKSFSWGGAAKLKTEPLARLLATTETVMSRRGQMLSANERELLTRHYHESVKEES
jgi:UDP-N-acetylglucosamine diphosphorylase/glucosamine-1-phosphate N-acetyltransferase